MVLNQYRHILMFVLLFTVVLSSGCSKSIAPGTTPDDGRAKARAAIEESLKSNANNGAVTWAPDGSMVLYTQKGQAEKADFSSVMAWRLNEAQAKSIAEVSPGFKAFTWSPDSQNFLISESPGEGVINRLFGAETLTEALKFNSLDIPVLHLGDSKAQMIAALGSDYKESPPSDEIMNFPEPVYSYSYPDSYEVFIGQNSGGILEILALRPGAQTNLGIKVGDTAARVFEVYRGKYIEPDSIHDGKLYGVFKVEGAAALAFHFNIGSGATRDDIKPDSKVTGITLTYPNNMDDDF